MLTATTEPCTTMADVRRHVDALDERIAGLIIQRCGYMSEAARIKQHASQIVDPARIEYIVDRVRAMARDQGAPEAVLETAYRALIAASIEFERQEFARLRAGAVQ